MITTLLLSLFLSKSTTFEKKEIKCFEPNEKCFQLSPTHFVSYHYLDGYMYEESHFYTKDIQSRYEKVDSIFSTSKKKIKTYMKNYSSFSDNQYIYNISIEQAPSFVGIKKVFVISKTESFFK